MNNKEFVAALAATTGYSLTDTQKMVVNVVNAMSDRFQEGDAVLVPNFGAFEIKKKMERIMVNPTTMQRMLVPPKLVLGSRPATSWKEEVRKAGES